MKRSLLLAGLTVLIWSTTAPMVKVLVGTMPNLETLAVSGFFAFLFLLLMNLCRGKLVCFRSYRPAVIGKMAGLGFLGLFLYSALYYYGLSVLPAQEACILNYLWPIMIVLFSCPILKEPLTGMKCAALLCSFAGIVILSVGGGIDLGGNRFAGVAACIIAAACYGLFSVLNKKLDMDQDHTMMIVWLVTAVCSALLGIVTEDWILPHGLQWLGLLWLGIVVDAIAYLTWALALRDAENTAAVANLAYLVPLLAMIISAVFLNEGFELRAILALILIVGGIFLQQFFGSGKKSSG